MVLRVLDKAIFFTVLAVGIIWIVLLNAAVFAGSGEDMVQVIQSGKVIAEYSLNAEIREKRFDSVSGGYNLLDISNHSALITDADCPDKVCMQSVIDRPNQAIVCLPNRLVIRIVGKSGEDTVAY